MILTATLFSSPDLSLNLFMAGAPALSLPKSSAAAPPHPTYLSKESAEVTLIASIPSTQDLKCWAPLHCVPQL